MQHTGTVNLGIAAMALGCQKKLAIIAMAICAASLTVATAAKNSRPAEEYVELHNAVRAVAGAGPVSWDAEAARHAAKRAATGCAGFQSRSPAAAAGYGENVFRGVGMPPGKATWTAADAMRVWTAPAATEYVQVVWPGSDSVGCAHAVCAGGHGVVISCSYKPAVKEELKAAPLPSYCRYNITRCLDCPIC